MKHLADRPVEERLRRIAAAFHHCGLRGVEAALGHATTLWHLPFSRLRVSDLADDPVGDELRSLGWPAPQADSRVLVVRGTQMDGRSFRFLIGREPDPAIGPALVRPDSGDVHAIAHDLRSETAELLEMQAGRWVAAAEHNQLCEYAARRLGEVLGPHTRADRPFLHFVQRDFEDERTARTYANIRPNALVWCDPAAGGVHVTKLRPASPWGSLQIWAYCQLGGA